MNSCSLEKKLHRLKSVPLACVTDSYGNSPTYETKNTLILITLLSLTFMNFPTHADKLATAPDLIIVNAVIHTMDPNQPTAEALAIYGNRIMAVGSTKDIRKLAGSNTRTVDAKKRLVLPGFNDSHTHFLSGGFQLSSVDLRDANSQNEFAERIRTFAAKLPAGSWIKGGDWDHERWPDAKLPTKELIDSFTPETPVFVNRLDGHMALANSLALRLAGVTRQTLDPPGGVIVRDPKTGEPTGILKDAAQALFGKLYRHRASMKNLPPLAQRQTTQPVWALRVFRICQPAPMSAFIKHSWIEANSRLVSTPLLRCRRGNVWRAPVFARTSEAKCCVLGD
jgi:hypothetical protein